MDTAFFLCHSSDIPLGRAKGFSIGERRIFVVNKDGEFFAYVNSCAHLRIPLEWHPDDFICKDTDLIRCATHGALFLPENGLCVSGPCDGQSLQTVAIKLVAGDVYCVDVL